MSTDERDHIATQAIQVPRPSPLPWLLLGIVLVGVGVLVIWGRSQIEEEKSRTSTALRTTDSTAAKLRDLNATHQALQEQIRRMGEERTAFEAHLKALNEELNERDQETEQLKATHALLSEALKDQVRQGVVAVTLGKGRVQVALPSGVFEDSSLELSARGKELLGRIGAALRKVDPKQAIQVSGYTEDQPLPTHLAERYASHWDLSAAQAVLVTRFLVERSSLPGQRVSAAGYGKFYPLTSNATPNGEIRQRRVEILLAPAHLAEPSDDSRAEARNRTKGKKKRR